MLLEKFESSALKSVTLPLAIFAGILVALFCFKLPLEKGYILCGQWLLSMGIPWGVYITLVALICLGLLVASVWWVTRYSLSKTTTSE